jgi:hypothetical protein
VGESGRQEAKEKDRQRDDWGEREGSSVHDVPSGQGVAGDAGDAGEEDAAADEGRDEAGWMDGRAGGFDKGCERRSQSDEPVQGQQNIQGPGNNHFLPFCGDPHADRLVRTLFDTAYDRPVTHAPLVPHQYKPFNNVCAAFIEDPTITNLCDLLIFPRLGLTAALSLKGSDFARYPDAFPHVAPHYLRPRPAPGPVTPADRAEREAKNGRLGRAARALLPSNPLADLSDRATREKLQDLHPEGVPNPFGKTSTPRHVAPSFPDIELIKTCFASIKRETAPGPSGWTQPLLKLAMGRERFRDFLVLYVKIVRGRPREKTYCLADSLQSELILMMRDAFDWFSRSSGSFSCSCRLLRAVGKSKW